MKSELEEIRKTLELINRKIKGNTIRLSDIYEGNVLIIEMLKYLELEAEATDEN